MNLKSCNIKIGSMIETPSAVLIIDDIRRNVDFVSIGTNDLTRYTLASENFSTPHLHKSLAKLIEVVIQTAKNYDKPLFLCGEITAKQKILDKLINLGISNFSIGLKHLQSLKKIC